MDQAFAAANGLTDYDPAAVVTGEHSGLENPNMTAAFTGAGITTFAQDGSRQPTQYSIGNALGAPRTRATSTTTQPTGPTRSASTTRCTWPRVTRSATWPSRTRPAAAPHLLHDLPYHAGARRTTSSRRVPDHAGPHLNNDPRVNYAHQPNLMADPNHPSDGYTLLTTLSYMQNLYQTWSTAPFILMTDVDEAHVLQQQSAWAKAEQGGNYTASETNGVVTVANNGAEVNIPITAPSGTTVNGNGAFGQAYGGDLSDWVDLGTGASETLNENVAPTITSASSATSIVGAPFSFTVTTTGEPTATLTETGALPTGITFTDNGNGTATIAGTAASSTGAASRSRSRPPTPTVRSARRSR